MWQNRVHDEKLLCGKWLPVMFTKWLWKWSVSDSVSYLILFPTHPTNNHFISDRKGRWCFQRRLSFCSQGWGVCFQEGMLPPEGGLSPGGGGLCLQDRVGTPSQYWHLVAATAAVDTHPNGMHSWKLSITFLLKSI